MLSDIFRDRVVICLFMLLLAGVLFVATGCGTTPEQRMDLAGKWLAQAKDWSKQLDDSVAGVELALEQVTLALQDPTLPQDQVQELLKIKAEAESLRTFYREKKALVDSDIAKLTTLVDKAKADGNGVVSEMELYGAGLQVVGNRVGGQAGGWITLGGALLGALAGVLGGLLKNAQTQRVLTGVVGSVTAMLSRQKPEDAEANKAVLRQVQGVKVENAVRGILGKPAKAI